MAQVTYPGVYVQEVPSGVRPIAAVSTSVAGFIGVAEKGPVGESIKVFNFTEYQNRFGAFLPNGYLSHAVYQFFNNGGTQCYVVRVAGAGNQTANIVLKDRGATPQNSITISASSPGAWGNSLGVLITDGINDPGDEFNVSVFDQDQPAVPLETFTNVSMVPGAPNFVETVTSSSRTIRVSVNASNTNAQAGTSRGATAPVSLQNTGRTRLRVNVNGDGFQEIDLQTAVGANAGQVADLTSAANIAGAITFAVRHVTKLRGSTNANAFANFTCSVDTNALLLTSGAAGLTSIVNVVPASVSSQDASGLLKLGPLQGGKETFGAAVTRPRNNPAGTPPANYFLLGDNAAPTNEVATVRGGLDGTPITTDQPYIDGLQAFNSKDDVSLLAVPGIGSPALVGAGMNYCANRPLSDCFFIGDMSQDDDTIDEAKAFRDALTPKNSYGAVYMPWVRALDPTGASAEPLSIPPSGFAAGQYARTDGRVGVWKAPAGTSAALGGAVGLTANLTDAQQGNLNPINVNVIRQFAGSGVVLWGARTITSDPDWTYVPVRRMAIFLRVSIYRGIQWAVFEPNDEDLWASLRLNINSFMLNLFRQGAFQGATPSQAFFVKCDAETTTADDINLGVVNVLVGFAPLKPAEFVIVKVSQQAGPSA